MAAQPPQPVEVSADMPIPVNLTAGDVQNLMVALDEIPHKVAKNIEPKLQQAVVDAMKESKEFKEGDSEPK